MLNGEKKLNLQNKKSGLINPNSIFFYLHLHLQRANACYSMTINHRNSILNATTEVKQSAWINPWIIKLIICLMVSELIQIVRHKNNSIFSHYFNIISKSLEKCFFWWFRKSTRYCIAGMMCNSKGRFCWDGPSFDRCVYQNKSSRSEDCLCLCVCVQKYLICLNISTFLEQLFKQVWKID